MTFSTGKCLPSSTLGTCDFLLFFDKLFDSLNGSLIKPGNGKYLRCAVTKTSPHLKFWDEAIHVLDTIRFFSSKNKEFVPPSVKNWITTTHFGPHSLLLRQISLEVGLCKTRILNILRKYKYHPYKTQCHQQIFAIDEESKKVICYEMQERANDRRFLSTRCFTDEV
jgi:hypothetical protein